MYSAYKFNKQGDNIQPWCTPFPIWNQSVVPYLVLTVASWPAHRFLKRQVRWSGIPTSFRIFHSLLWSTQRMCFMFRNDTEREVIRMGMENFSVEEYQLTSVENDRIGKSLISHCGDSWFTQEWVLKSSRDRLLWNGMPIKSRKLVTNCKGKRITLLLRNLADASCIRSPNYVTDHGTIVIMYRLSRRPEKDLMPLMWCSRPVVAWFRLWGTISQFKLRDILWRNWSRVKNTKSLNVMKG